MGMYNVCDFSKFSITDVEKFQRRIRKWCKEECMPGRSMLIFDQSSFKVGGEPVSYKDATGEYYKVVLSQISITYMRIADTSMCMMYRIWENKTESVMYNIPKKWDGTELWLCE